jgi:DNA-binding CsgD family transcriptional regulator
LRVAAMNLSHNEADIVFTIMRELAGSQDATELRQTVGSLVLRLFDAQHLVSYVWDHPTQRFAERVAINMDDSNLANRDRHFQFCDPITPTLQRRRTATRVADIISRRHLERTEFFNDFLARDGLYYGINFYAYAGDRNIGDLRIWRSRHKEDFSRRDTAILDAIGAAFTQALLRCRLRQASQGAADMDVLSCIERAGREKGLTPRQREIASAILLGNSDRTIADQLCISLPTVRTHIQAIYQKIGVSSRTRLTRALMRY